MGPPGGPIFWDRMHSLVKEQKKSTFTVPFLGPSGGTKKEDRKIAKSTAKADPCNKQKMTCVKQQAYRVGTAALPVAISHQSSLKPNVALPQP